MKTSELQNQLTVVIQEVQTSVVEMLWPTRCVLCDTPGAVLCEYCKRNLFYLDQWRACPICGAAFGLVQCAQCSAEVFARLGRSTWPFAACVSAVMFGDEAGRIVRTYKDQGERRLASEMAHSMVNVLPPSWCFDAVTCVPASKQALRRRGFDHAELLARSVADEVGSTFESALKRPLSKDQRKLSGRARRDNLWNCFTAHKLLTGRRLLLVDDVFTTGATLCEATDALVRAEVATVYCLTFARVY